MARKELIEAFCAHFDELLPDAYVQSGDGCIVIMGCARTNSRQHSVTLWFLPDGVRCDATGKWLMIEYADPALLERLLGFIQSL